MREAVIQLRDEELAAMGFKAVVDATRAAGLRDVTELVCQGDGGILQVRVEDPIPPADLDGFESVAWWERLSSGENLVTYLMKVEPTMEPDDGASLDETATAHEITGVSSEGLAVSVVGSDAEISESMAAIDEAGVTPLLQRLTDYDGRGSSPGDRLTDRQREVVETAYEMGYYEIPREVSTEDVADTVELDPSTVAEHLQRAERNVFATVVDPPA